MASSDDKEKFDTLVLATQALTQQVATLTSVVEINNQAIKQLQREINQKPDDVELSTIAAVSKQERSQQLRFGVISAVLASVVSGGISTAIAVDYAQEGYRERLRQNNAACHRNNERAIAVSDAFTRAAETEMPVVRQTFIDASARLDALQADCDRLHPIP